jgi:ABC-type antimicrobial peptide transport system permease subunit
MLLAGIVLVAACANLGSLFALRTLDRTREIAIRVAIGSNRWRIFRQLLVEALLISILAGTCACALAWLTLTGLADWRPPTPFPFKFLVLPQPALILVALLISVLAAILFGLLPLRQIFATDPNDALKSGGYMHPRAAAGLSEISCSPFKSLSVALRLPPPLSRCAA